MMGWSYNLFFASLMPKVLIHMFYRILGVVYWDRWMQVAKQAEALDKANCRLVYQ